MHNSNGATYATVSSRLVWPGLARLGLAWLGLAFLPFAKAQHCASRSHARALCMRCSPRQTRFAAGGDVSAGAAAAFWLAERNRYGRKRFQTAPALISTF